MKIDFCYYLLNSGFGDIVRETSAVRVDQAPRGAHRHRQDDLMGLLLTIRGDHRYRPEELTEITEMASLAFFREQGSVTRAIQICFDEVNKKILARNLDRGYEGVRAEGSLNFAVLHQGSLFIGQAGETYSIFLGKAKFEQWGDATEKGIPLGASKRFPIRFYQCDIQPDDLVVLSPNLPASWNAQNLAGSAGQPMANIKRRLLNQVTSPLDAVVILLGEGKGNSRPCLWGEQDETVPQNEILSGSIPPSASPGIPALPADEVSPNEEKMLPDQTSVDNFGSQDEELGQDDTAESIEAGEAIIEVGPGEIPVLEGQTEKPDPLENNSYRKPSKFLLSLAHGWMGLKVFKNKIQNTFHPIFNFFDHTVNPRFSSVRDAMRLIVTISLPIILVLASNMVYSQSGKKEQHQLFMQEAQSFAELALNEKDTPKQRDYWIQALDFAQKAESYDSTQQSRMILNQAQTTLDEMDLVKRLDFRPALTQYFPEGVVITKIQASSSGVFLLDTTSGSLLRIYLNSKGFYELDQEFSCTPGPYGLTNVSKLVDFVMLPANKDNYKVLAMDASGNLLYCRPGNPPVSRSLPEPEGGWKRIIGAAYDQDILYVLDADSDVVWMFQGKDPDNPELSGIVFSESPVNFFDSDIPDLGGAMDLSVNQEDLYILHQDGHMTVCQYSPQKEINLTECQDPFAYTDNRVGHEKNPLIFTGAHLTLLQNVRLPNAALYMLEANSRSIFQFSFQLNLEQTLKVQPSKNYPVPDISPSGFGISPEQDVFLAYNNQLFVAPLR